MLQAGKNLWNYQGDDLEPNSNMSADILFDVERPSGDCSSAMMIEW